MDTRTGAAYLRKNTAPFNQRLLATNRSSGVFKR